MYNALHIQSAYRMYNMYECMYTVNINSVHITAHLFYMTAHSEMENIPTSFCNAHDDMQQILYSSGLSTVNGKRNRP